LVYRRREGISWQWGSTAELLTRLAALEAA